MFCFNKEDDPESRRASEQFETALKNLYGKFKIQPKPGELETPDMPEAYRQEARIRFPSTTSFSVDLPQGFKQQGTTFDHFGLMNMMKSGHVMTIYFGDLEHDGKREDFSRDPGWVGSGNRVTFRDREQVGVHDFGFSEKTNFAGGKPGEVGGGLWRAASTGSRHELP